MSSEIPFMFKCASDSLLGILHEPRQPAKIGVLIVVGGPQYRVGSHRQFILLARRLAANGITVMRFDYRGMGDAEGQQRNFANVDQDIASAIDAFCQRSPNLSDIILWGLCDAASAALFYGYQDERITGLVLLNPWVFTEQGAAKTYLKHYYLKRLLNRELWRKVFSLKFNYIESLASFFRLLEKRYRSPANSQAPDPTHHVKAKKVEASLELPIRMRECLRRFKHPILFILSGKDLTADEFRETIQADEEWQALLKNSQISRFDLNLADHTFSTQAWRHQVEQRTLSWLQTLNEAKE